MATTALAKTNAVPVWGGFEYQWVKHAHRLSLLMSRFSEDSHELALKIGACPPDTAKYEVPYQMLTPSHGLLVRQGTITLQTSGKINHWQSGSGTAAVKLPESGAENAVVVLNGFRIRSRSLDLSNTGKSCNLKGKIGVWGMTVATGCKKRACAKWDSGWHFSGISIGVKAIREPGKALTIQANVKVKPSDSPDEINGGDCRCHGANWPTEIACPHRIEVDYLVLANAPSQLATKGFVVADNTQRSTRWKLTKTLNLSGTPGFQSATVGMTLFSMEIKRGRYPQPGRYVRQLGFRLTHFSYKKKTGRAKIGTKAIFSNISELPHWWAGKARIEGVLIQFKKKTMLKHYRLEGTLSEGNKQSLPLEN
jgi:hypothetical protein